VAMKFLKPFVVLLLLLGFTANCFNYWILSSSYTFNKKYISTVLCSNKAHPELHCEGKCFMDIKLKELEQKNKQEQNQVKRMIETVAPVQFTFKLPILETYIQSPLCFYLSKKPSKALIDIFQPPKYA
jgi:hypothetical protein